MSELHTLFQHAKPIPCGNTWDTLTGEDKQRTCKDCHRSVHNMAELTMGEFETISDSNPDRLCVVYEPRFGTSLLLLKICAAMLPILLLAQIAWAAEDKPAAKALQKCTEYMYTPMMNPPNTPCLSDDGKPTTLHTSVDELYKKLETPEASQSEQKKE